MVYLITYDLRKPGQNYDDLYTAIKSVGEWIHPLESTWLVNSQLDAKQIHEFICQYIDRNDNVLVIRVTRDYWGWLPKSCWEWLDARL